MTIGEKLLHLNLGLQNLQHSTNADLFATTLPASLTEIKNFIRGLPARHLGMNATCADCLNAIERAIEETNQALADHPPADFYKDSRLSAIKESMRKALLSVYDNCGYEEVNIAHLEAH